MRRVTGEDLRLRRSRAQRLLDEPVLQRLGHLDPKGRQGLLEQVLVGAGLGIARQLQELRARRLGGDAAAVLDSVRALAGYCHLQKGGLVADLCQSAVEQLRETGQLAAVASLLDVIERRAEGLLAELRSAARDDAALRLGLA
ncbi:hypothetical protein [Aquabacterium sp. J223]|uniref:hypothetical protein n=1 Tax=Aquabacterium sp. J223 TaxID=2898431 RepID=UPI0021ADBCC8|nr:hypothetical protein [Aquabacterium sp. J223]UUX94858.1 hypothetical protein LRS07_16520 [Aquabacterium sp. J223]